MPTIEEVKNRFDSIQGHVAVAIWQREDIRGRAKDKGIKITNYQIDELLDEIDRKQDCELGITWTTIDCFLDEFNERRKEVTK